MVRTRPDHPAHAAPAAPAADAADAAEGADRVAAYDYNYPPQAVAQEPPARRDEARLLIVPRVAGADASAPALRDAGVRELPSLLRPGDLLVLNDTTVLPARLVGKRASGGRVSVLVLAPRGRAATVMLGSRATLQPGELLDVHGDRWRIARSLGEGRFEIEVEQGRDVPALLAQSGRMPLPPYIRRDPVADPRDALDRERYQTTFAQGAQLATGAQREGPGVPAAATPAAVAAPTAGLHFTPELLAAAAARGVAIARLRLDVGEGTFRPLRGERLDEHVMHEERFEIPEATAAAFALARRRGDRVVAVGTTVVRALESAVEHGGAGLRAGPASTRLFIRPGHRFSAVDALLTNFHQPRSTLLVLVSAFAGRQTMRAAYAHAIAGGYRLFSYGDAMLIA